MRTSMDTISNGSVGERNSQAGFGFLIRNSKVPDDSSVPSTGELPQSSTGSSRERCLLKGYPVWSLWIVHLKLSGKHLSHCSLPHVHHFVLDLD